MSAPTTRPSPVTVVTGLAGSGMSTALKMLEDLGYEAVDNLPLSLAPALIEERAGGDRPLALSVDSRTRDFSAAALLATVAAFKARPDLETRLLFLDCDDEVLQRRFTETRRRHPLAMDRPVTDGIRLDRRILAPIRDEADLTLDTSLLTIHDLRRWLAGNLALDQRPALSVFVTSFAFRRGLPREADLVFDARFLDNPHWDPALRDLTGLDAPVQQRIDADPDFDEFMSAVKNLLAPLLPRYNREGKSYLTIAIGCSGGKHRSVYIATRLAAWLDDQGYRTGLSHRDLPAALHSDAPAPTEMDVTR